MTVEREKSTKAIAPDAEPRRELPPAAKRALAEAEERRLRRQSEIEKSGTAKDGSNKPQEFGGREGPDPVRYGDWEKAGRCIDF